MAEATQKQPNPTASRPVRCIVKLGGAAITNKGELESIGVENLRSACAQLRQAMSHSGATEKVAGMDWSRRPGDPTDPVVDAEGLSEMEGLGLDTNFVVVHGAGSFGHFQASRSGVHKGGLQSTLVKAGFVATRISVTSLNQEIVRALARGIPSVGMSPFACGWSTKQRNLESANASQIIQSLHVGFVPVLHGDAVLDELLDCTILSGDVIIRHLAQLLNPKYVVFLTDVHGVYDRPPSDPNAVLLREIEVDDTGSWSIVKPALKGSNKGVEISVAAHDTTGGMETKILEAAAIARLGVDVYITKVGTEHSLRALQGDTSSEDWLGTVIRSSK
ncbi:isopentenyl phosphate kinase isoform X2 [Oryza brachyantha]|uniref:isopentenyl phosphate kinase isoform X2 n=1 Tax=Oryza brachyantha TaxID=4533 RepID=UPI001ADAF051|nr:isopentenyl phosphate kinase isoform X2 [Oryza brachyantha]